jgi:hypothetical protein
MKTWFVFLINGKKVGTWANNELEARKNMSAEYGEDTRMEFLGINYCGKFGPQPEEIIHRGMTPVDTMIAFGFANMFIGLRN